MAKVFYKSLIPNDEPQWLLNVQQAVKEVTGVMHMRGDERDWKNLKSFIDRAIEAQHSRGIMQEENVRTELRTDNGRTALIIFRNYQIMQTYYIE